FNEKNSLEAQVVGTITSDNYRHYNHYDIPGNNNFVNDVNNRRRSLISEISYVHGFDQTMTLSGGIQNSMSHNTNEYIGKDFKPVLTDNNNYIYARFSKQFSRVYLTAATGMKLFWTRNDDIRRNFIRNLSSLNASWYLGQKWVVQGSFSYTPVIPSLAQLTEYEVETTPYLSKSGNPNLKVGEHFSYVLSGQYTHRKFSASIMTGVYDFKNAPFYDVVYKGNGKFLSQILNADKCFTWQSALQLRISEIYGFGANVALILSRYESAINDWNYHLTSFSGTMNLWWHKGPWIVSYYRKFPGKDLFSYNVSREENSDILQVEFRPDKHWTLGIGWWYMFEKKGTKYPSWSYSHVNPSYTRR
ncbi:MAG: outer membrane beta-barrel family protein, partial [Muribaculaceae bacterium]|nr:outer membrane beta-barrel family protein [Muribaculaceae bacterium]